MVFRACFFLIRRVARVLGRPDRQVRVVRLLPHGTPPHRPAPLRLAHDARHPDEARWAGRDPK